MAVKYYRDFSGGFSDNAEQTTLPDNVMGNIELMYWDGRLKRMPGPSTLVTATAAGATGIYGIIHDSFYGTGYVLAIQDATNIKFYSWNPTVGWTTIGSKTFTSNYRVYFAYLNGYIVASNGYDKPLAIWYSSATYYSNDLEQVDVRTRDNADWKAGQYVASGPTYTDDTTDGQDAGADDFAISTVTNNDGFWIACFYLFTKVVLTSASQMTGSPVAVYEYYKGSGVWGSLTLTTTPAWTAAAGDRTLEFDCPSDWVVYDDDTETNLANRFVIRIRYTTATSADTVDSIALSFTRSVSWALQNQTAGIVVEHGGRLWISAGELVAYSNYNSALGWEPYFIEYFQGGQKTIYNLVSHQNALYVFKNSVIWKYSGTSFDNYIKTKIADIGTIDTRCAVSAGDQIIFTSLARCYAIAGNDTVVEVLSHVNLTTMSDLCYWDNKVLATTAAATQYMIDPAKITQIGGKPCMAVFNISRSGYAYTFYFLRYDLDDVYLIGISTAVTSIYRYDNSTWDIEGNPLGDPSTVKLKTGLIDNGQSSTRKVVPRIKVEARDGADLVVSFKDDAGTTIASGTQTRKLDFDGLTNSITNGDFEAVITSGWNNAIGTATGVTRDTSVFRSGAASMKIKPVAATGTDTGRGNDISPTAGAEPVSKYITGYYKCTSFTAGSVIVDVGSALTHATSFIYKNLVTIDAVTSDWTKFEAAVAIRDDGANVGAFLKVYSPTGSSMTCYIDDITIYPLTKFVTYEFTPPYQVDGKNFALELSQTSLAETSIKSIGIEYSPRRF